MVFKEFKPFQGPSQFTFVDPDTKRLFKGSSIPNLAAQITGYRSQNELPPIEYLEIVIENFLCSLPVHVGLCGPRKSLPSRTLTQYIHGGIALLKNIAYRSFVSQEKANERASICIKCPHNVFPDRGPFIKWIDDIAQKSVGKRKSIHHDKLGNCEICSCPLRSKIYYNGKIELTPEQRSQMKALENPKCWQVENDN